MSEELDKLKRENEVLKSKLSKLEDQSIQNIRSYKWTDTLTQEEIDFIVEMKIVNEMIDYNSCTGDSHVTTIEKVIDYVKKDVESEDMPDTLLDLLSLGLIATSVLSKALLGYLSYFDKDSLDAFIYSEYGNKDDAYLTELNLIKKFKLFDLARYNIVQSHDFVESIISIRDEENKKSDFLLGVNELSIAMEKITNNIDINHISDVIDKSNDNLYLLLSTNIKDDNVAFKSDREKAISDERLSKFKLIKLEEEDLDEVNKKNKGPYTGGGYGCALPPVGEDIGKWYRVIKFLKSKTVNRKFYSRWYDSAEMVIDYIYNYATPLEQYIFISAFSKKDEEEICEFLLIDWYDFYEAISNMVSPLYSLERNSTPWGDNRYV